MNRNEREIRTCCREVRAAPAEEGHGIRFEGYAAVFDSWSEDLGGFRERIARGAFSKAIQKDDVRCLLNHDPNYVLGRNTAGTCQLDEDEKGLHFIVDAPDTAWARDLRTSVERGDINQCSFSFVPRDGGQIWQGINLSERILTDVELFDVSIVTYPAYTDTTASARALEAARKEHNHGSTDVLRKKLDLMEGKDNE